MQFGEAFLSLIPQLDSRAAATTQAEASRVGQQSGKALADSFDRAAKLPEVVVKVATEVAKRGIDSVQDALRQLRDKVVNVDVDASKAKTEIGSLTKETRLLTSTMVALGPAAVPVLGSIGAAAVGAGAAVGSAGAAIGVFGAAFGTAFAEIKKNTDTIDLLNQKLQIVDQNIRDAQASGESTVELEKQREKILDQINAQYDIMGARTSAVADQYQNLKGTWKEFVELNKPAIYSVMSSGFASVTTAIGLVQPLFDIGAAAAQRFADKLATFVNGGGLQSFVAYLSGQAGPALDNLGAIAKNVGTFLVNMLKGFAPSGQSFLTWLNEATAKLAEWSAGNGLQEFIEYMTDNGPRVGSSLAEIAGAAVKLTQAVTPLAPITLAIASGLAALIKAVPVPVLTTIIGLFVAYNVALVAYNLYTGIAAAATKAWAATQWLLNAAMAANPVGLIVVAIIALVAAIVLAYKNSETFRNIVDKVWAAIKVAIKATVDWFVNTAWPAIKVALQALGDFFSWLWKNAIVPAWNGIKAAIEAAWPVIKTIFGAIVDYVKLVADIYLWLWKNVVIPVWNGIKVAIDVAWSAIKVIFAAIETYVKAIGAIYTWLWRNIIEPVWNGIKLAIQVAWVAIQIIFKSVEIAVKLLGATFDFLWKNVIVPVWNGIKTATQVWWTAVKIIFDAVMAFIRGAFAATWNWLWKNLIEPVWNGIKTATQLWWNAVKAIFDAVMAFIRGPLATAWNWLRDLIQTIWNRIKEIISAAWNWVRDNVLNPIINFIKGPLKNAWDTFVNIIQQAWNRFKSDISAVWNWVKGNVFDPLANVITRTIPDAFDRGVSAVKSAWDKIKEAAAVPVRFVVNTVINGGIIKGFNWIASKVGVSPIPEINLGFAKGGVLPGWSPGRDIHKFISPTGGRLELSGGEAIMRPEFTKAMGPAFIYTANRIARGRGSKGVRDYMRGWFRYGNSPTGPMYSQGGVYTPTQRFAEGGIVGAIGKAWDALTNPAETFKAGISGLMRAMPGGPFVKDVLTSTIDKLVDGVVKWINEKFSVMGSGAGPGNWEAMWNWVKSRFPQAQLYSGLRNSTTISGNRSLHADGRAIDVSPIRAISQAIIAAFGKNITELISPWPEEHIWHGQRHDYSDAIDRQHGVYGDNAHVHWAMRNGGVFRYDNGGWFNPGQLGINTLRKPEAVLTPEETRGLKAMSTDDLATLLREIRDAIREVAPGVGDRINGIGSRLIVKNRIR